MKPLPNAPQDQPGVCADSSITTLTYGLSGPSEGAACADCGIGQGNVSGCLTSGHTFYTTGILLSNATILEPTDVGANLTQLSSYARCVTLRSTSPCTS